MLKKIGWIGSYKTGAELLQEQFRRLLKLPTAHEAKATMQARTF